jgi:Zinc finger, C3HC4 type (RING finger)
VLSTARCAVCCPHIGPSWQPTLHRCFMSSRHDDDDNAVRVAYQQASDFLKDASLQLLAAAASSERCSVHDDDATTALPATTTTTTTSGAAVATTVATTPTTTQLTRGMHEALQQWQAKVTCPLCHLIMVRPVSLTMCGHTFCESCIDDYVDNSWTCPSTYSLNYQLPFYYH